MFELAEGHRKRLRKRFEEENINTIPDYIVLEMMLQGMISRRDTCELARTLIKRFGSLPNVIDASVADLCTVEGMGEAAASYIKLIPAFYRKYALEKWGENIVFNSITECKSYLESHFIGAENEMLTVLCMNAGLKLLGCRPVFAGTVNAINVNIRKIVEYALSLNSSRVVIAHNHLHESATPSYDDLLTTKKIIDALKMVDIHLDDHIIFSNNTSFSFVEMGCFEALDDIIEASSS